MFIEAVAKPLPEENFSGKIWFQLVITSHQRPGMSRPRAVAGSDEPDGAILRACAFLSYFLIVPWIGAVAFRTCQNDRSAQFRAPDGHMHAARATPR